MAAALGALQDAQENLDAFRENTEAIRLLGDDWSTWLAQYVDAVSQAEQRIDALGARAAVDAHGLTVEALQALPREEKQQVVRAFVDVVFLRPAQGGRGRHASPVSDRTLILWKGTGPSTFLALGGAADRFNRSSGRTNVNCTPGLTRRSDRAS